MTMIVPTFLISLVAFFLLGFLVATQLMWSIVVSLVRQDCEQTGYQRALKDRNLALVEGTLVMGPHLVRPHEVDREGREVLVPGEDEVLRIDARAGREEGPEVRAVGAEGTVIDLLRRRIQRSH